MTTRFPLAALAAATACAALLVPAGAARATAATLWTVSTLDSFAPDATDMTGLDRPRVAADPNGDAIAAWIRPVDANTHEVMAASMAAGGSFGSPQAITTSGIASDLQVSMDASGNTTITWMERTDPAATTGMIRTATRAAGSSSCSLATVETSGQGPRLAANSAGDSVLAWTAAGGTQGDVMAAVRHGAGAWDSPKQLGDGGRPAAAVHGQGNALVAWSLTSGQEALTARSRPRATTATARTGAACNSSITSRTRVRTRPDLRSRLTGRQR